MSCLNYWENEDANDGAIKQSNSVCEGIRGKRIMSIKWRRDKWERLGEYEEA